MTVPANLLQLIRDRVRAGHYTLGRHVIRHGVQEGFTLAEVFTTIEQGLIIEHYPDRRRCLICARVRTTENLLLWLHVACSYYHPVTVGIVTAYVPNADAWDYPPVRRRAGS